MPHKSERWPYNIHRTLVSLTDLLTHDPLDEHPSTEQIAAYLSGGLTTVESEAVDVHLASCRRCRTEVVTARRVLRARSPRRQWRWAIPTIAAAALAFVLFRSGSNRLDDQPVRGIQDSSGIDVTSLGVFAPASGDTVAVRDAVFMWQRRLDQALYRFTLTDAAGRAVWTAETSDTTVRLPKTVTLDAGRTYLWFVEALGADGRSLSTGTRSFTVRP